ncbi:MAG: flagellar hook-length control protein FliK [Rhodobacteraceae bacterium]|nr:flagellar hook-length control protein FliK [Paracoccaceae bacterium]
MSDDIPALDSGDLAPAGPAIAALADIPEVMEPVVPGVIPDAVSLGKPRGTDQPAPPPALPAQPAQPAGPVGLRTETGPAKVPSAHASGQPNPVITPDRVVMESNQPPAPVRDNPVPLQTANPGVAPVPPATGNGLNTPPGPPIADTVRAKPAPATPPVPAAPITPSTAPRLPAASGLNANDNAATPEISPDLMGRTTEQTPANSATSAGRTQPPATLSPRHVAAQVASLNLQPGAPMEIALDPPELGKVRLTLLNGENGMTIQISAERADTIDLLRRHAGILMDEFQRQGQRDPSLDFSREHSDRRPETPAARGEWLIETDEAAPASPHSSPIHAISPARNLRLSGLDIRF